MKNPYFSYGTPEEQKLYSDLVREAIEIYGANCYYIPRKLVTYDDLFGEDINSSFDESYIIDLYLESYQNFEGQGDLFTKFGVQINDQAVFTVSRMKWEMTLQDSNNLISSKRPNEGDLIYYPLSKSLFQIVFVEHEEPFWQIADVQMYKLRCELFTYSQESLPKTPELLDFKTKYSFAITLTLSNITGTFVKNENIVSDTFEAIVSEFNVDTGELKVHSRNENPVEGAELQGLLSGATGTITAFKTMDETSRPEDSDNLYLETKNAEQWEYEEDNAFGEFQLDGNF